MAADNGLATYTELAEVLDRLPMILREARRQRRLSTRAAGRQVGVSGVTILRVEAGEDCTLSTAVAFLRWLDRTTPADRTEEDPS